MAADRGNPACQLKGRRCETSSVLMTRSPCMVRYVKRRARNSEPRVAAHRDSHQVCLAAEVGATSFD